MIDVLRPQLGSPAAETFWAGCAEEVLLLPHCCGCGRVRWYLQVRCPWCRAKDVRWEPASGFGTVFSFTIVERAFHPSLTSWVPYVVGLVELEESETARFVTRIVGCRPDQVEVGMPVEVSFERIDDELALPFFAPRRAVG